MSIANEHTRHLLKVIDPINANYIMDRWPCISCFDFTTRSRILHFYLLWNTGIINLGLTLMVWVKWTTQAKTWIIWLQYTLVMSVSVIIILTTQPLCNGEEEYWLKRSEQISLFLHYHLARWISWRLS